MLQWQKEEQILTRVPWVISLTWKQFQSINIFVESYDNIERAKNSTFSHTWQLNGPYLKKLVFPIPEDALCQIMLKLAQLFWRKIFSKFRQCIFAILLLSPLWKWLGHLNKHESPSPRMLCYKFCWNWPSGSGGEDFQILLFPYYLP